MTVQLFCGDCLERMKEIESGSVDAIITDPPYNTTDCSWDKQPLQWLQIKRECMRVLSPTGSVVFTAQNPFTFMIGNLFIEIYRHRWIWQKNKCANFLSAKSCPLKYSEDILVFNRYGYQKSWNNNGKPKGTYNPQMTITDKPASNSGQDRGNTLRQINDRICNTRLVSDPEKDPNSRFPKDTIIFPLDKKGKLHPTQKPVALMEYLIKTYTNEGEIVLDFTAGSGTTGVAAINTNRNAILIEKDPNYCEIIKRRIDEAERRKNNEFFVKKPDAPTLFDFILEDKKQ